MFMIGISTVVFFAVTAMVFLCIIVFLIATIDQRAVNIDSPCTSALPVNHGPEVLEFHDPHVHQVKPPQKEAQPWAKSGLETLTT